MNVGDKFGRLVVIETGVRQDRGNTWHKCLCECGAERSVMEANLFKKKSRSCGCLSREITSGRARTHGMSKTPTYAVWARMVTRCTNPKASRYARYGGRGIAICERWQKFENFLADMGELPGAGFSIGRVNNDGHYCRENCRWETASQQSVNTSRNIVIEHDGVSMALSEWARRLRLPYATLIQRHRSGIVPPELFSAASRTEEPITVNGETLLTTEWMRRARIPISSFYSHIRKGLTREQVVAKYLAQRESK